MPRFPCFLPFHLHIWSLKVSSAPQRDRDYNIPPQKGFYQYSLPSLDFYFPFHTKQVLCCQSFKTVVPYPVSPLKAKFYILTAFNLSLVFIFLVLGESRSSEDIFQDIHCAVLFVIFCFLMLRGEDYLLQARLASEGFALTQLRNFLHFFWIFHSALLEGEANKSNICMMLLSWRK